MDILDIASEREEIARAAAIAANSQVTGPSPTGRCLWCDEVVGDYVRWCSVTCRNEWDKTAQRMKSH